MIAVVNEWCLKEVKCLQMELISEKESNLSKGQNVFTKSKVLCS